MSKVVKKQSAPDEFWWIPIVMVIQPNDFYFNWTTVMPSLWLKPNHNSTSHQLDKKQDVKEKYIVVNPANVGLFLVNYDLDNWKLLTARIDEMPETVRAQLLHDAISLALAGKLDMITMLNVTTFLKREQAPLVWKTFFPLGDRLRKMLVGTSAQKMFERYLQAIIVPPLDAVGEEADQQSPWKSDFRVKVRHLLCTTHFPMCIEVARHYYQTWMNLTNPDDGMP
ncbi:aminopeptidase N-like [Nilaparvata lugens]|uniref:aminopeptidase N-like n=1 Tax=Nilaparvata lugens TaxID=108931 RepID=UPI00193D3F2C|nr:aminopeptidase N-like [Nilaparvata lugens]